MKKQVEKVVEALRTATGTIVFEAFTYAPCDNLKHMRDMIDHILNERTKTN